MNNPGNQANRTIDKVFAKLRDAEAPAGMEDRILRTLEARQNSQGRVLSFPKIWVPQISILRPGCAERCVRFCLSLPKGICFFSPSRPQSRPRHSLPEWLLRPTTYIAASFALASLLIALAFAHSTRHPQTTPLQPQLASIPIASKSPESLPQPSPNRRPAQTIRKDQTVPQAQPLADEDALAISEMLAPSKPAPPLPLSRQEQLLAEAAHQADPEELASFNPDERARQLEISKSEFHDFFAPPPAKDSE